MSSITTKVIPPWPQSDFVPDPIFPVTALLASISDESLRKAAELKYGDLSAAGQNIRQRLRQGYFAPDEWYEALIDGLVTSQTRWLDVGCGRNLFPQNPALARELSRRCRRLVGIDPDEAVKENEFVHEHIQGTVSDRSLASGYFDLVTFRMVVEHVDDPNSCIQALRRLVAPGGRVIIYTVSKWSVTSVCATLTPMCFHHRLKRLLWNTEEKDTFPVRYLMNTRRRLEQLFRSAGFESEGFWSLPDVSFWKFPKLHWIELQLIRVCSALQVPYLDRCLLAVYRQSSPAI